MFKFFLTVSFLILGILNSFPIDNYPSGARALALSNAFVSFSDSWSTFHNQAGLAGLNQYSAGFYYEPRFQVKELCMTAGSVVLPSQSGTFGVSFFQFGQNSFKENKFGLAFSKQLSKQFSAGVQFDYFSQLLPENRRSKGFVTFEGGVIFSPFEKLFLGAHIFNPVFAGIETYSGKLKIPAVFRLGSHYRFSDMVLVTVETEKDVGNPVVLKTGIEFLPVQNLALRFGVSGDPFKYTAGIGYTTGKISTDIGFGYYGVLGITPAVSIQFVL